MPIKTFISTSSGVAVVCALVGALAGCGADVDQAEVPSTRPSVTPEGAALARDLPGRWSLVSVDDAALPMTTADQGADRELVEGRLVVEGDGAWTYRYDYRAPGGPSNEVWSSGLSGTWRAGPQRPAAVQFVCADDGMTYVASMLDRDAMTVTLAGRRHRFRRVPQ